MVSFSVLPYIFAIAFQPYPTKKITTKFFLKKKKKFEINFKKKKFEKKIEINLKK
jgi:hypothetical protein